MFGTQRSLRHMHNNFSSTLAHFRLALQLSLLLLSGAAIANAQADLPAGPGQVELERMCTRCHGVNVITGQRMSARLWTEEVHDMISRGAVGSDDEVQRLVAYLSTNFGNGQTAATMAGSSATSQRSASARHTGPATVLDAWPDANDGVTPQRLLHPNFEPKNWLTFAGTYSSQHYSLLNLIPTKRLRWW
jgi:hypothetical protein